MLILLLVLFVVLFFRFLYVYEGFRYMSGFHWQSYLRRYPDLLAALPFTRHAATSHWINHGRREGRNGKYAMIGFHWQSYMRRYPDLLAALPFTQQAATSHWLNHGLREGRNGLEDTTQKDKKKAEAQRKAAEKARRKAAEKAAKKERDKQLAAAKAAAAAAARAKAEAEAAALRAYKEVSMILTFPTHKTKVYELIKYNERRYDKNAYKKKYGKANFYKVGQFNHQYSNILPFDWKSYLERYPDLSRLPFSKEAAIDHWVTTGYKEGRVGSKNMNEVLCEPGELHCIETRIRPQRSETYNIDFNSPFDRYTTTNVPSDYNQAYYKTPFELNLPIVTNKPNEFNNVDEHIYPYTYCNWENNQPTCVFTTRKQTQEKHNSQVGDWLRKKQQTELARSIMIQKRVRANDSNQYQQYANDSLKYIKSI